MNSVQASPWVVGVVIVVALCAIALYGFHVLRPQAPNSDFKTPTSYPNFQKMHMAGNAAPAKPVQP